MIAPGQGRVKDHTAAELKKLGAGFYFEYEGIKISGYYLGGNTRRLAIHSIYLNVQRFGNSFLIELGMSLSKTK